MGFGSAVSVQVKNVPDFWARVRKSEHRLLALDYDGTLAPFHVDPMRAHPLPGIPALLDGLSRAGNTTVAIISGRPVQELNILLGHLGIALIGCHGFELIDCDGNITVKSPNREQLEGMERAIDAAARLGLHEKLETKTASIALHTRGMPANEASKIEEMILREWSGISSFDLGCRRFNGGVEMYCTGLNKADALNDLLRTQPPGALPVYIGDDATDEDVFVMLQEIGIGIKVGFPGMATAANGFLPSCEEVRAFLESWLSLELTERSLNQDGDQKTCGGFKPPAHRR